MFYIVQKLKKKIKISYILSFVFSIVLKKRSSRDNIIKKKRNDYIKVVVEEATEELILNSILNNQI